MEVHICNARKKTLGVFTFKILSFFRFHNLVYLQNSRSWHYCQGHTDLKLMSLVSSSDSFSYLSNMKMKFNASIITLWDSSLKLKVHCLH